MVETNTGLTERAETVEAQVGNLTGEYCPLPERSIAIGGKILQARGLEMSRAIEAIADHWVSDDIFVDMRDAREVDSGAIAALLAAVEYAHHLGHRVLVRAREPIARLLEQNAQPGAFVVLAA